MSNEDKPVQQPAAVGESIREGFEQAASAIAARALGWRNLGDDKLADELLQCRAMLHDMKPAAPAAGVQLTARQADLQYSKGYTAGWNEGRKELQDAAGVQGDTDREYGLNVEMLPKGAMVRIYSLTGELLLEQFHPVVQGDTELQKAHDLIWTLRDQLQERATVAKMMEDNLRPWNELRTDVLSGIDGLNNEQINSVLSVIYQHIPDDEAIYPATAQPDSSRNAALVEAWHTNLSKERAYLDGRTAREKAMLKEIAAHRLAAHPAPSSDAALVDALRNIRDYRTDMDDSIAARSMRFYAEEALADHPANGAQAGGLSQLKIFEIARQCGIGDWKGATLEEFSRAILAAAKKGGAE